MLRTNRWAACGLAWAIGAAACADVLHLHDGRVFEGVVVRGTDGAVTIDTMIGRIRTTLRFSAADVDRVEERPLPAAFFDHPRDDAARAAADLDAPSGRARDATYYVEAPIRGVFGIDVLPRAIEETLDFAVRRGIRHVVFTIDSPGGEVWAADAIALLLERFADRVTCHAIVERAISAAIWVAFSCDHIYVAPNAAMGAAVVFRGDASTGHAAVDAKMTSAYAGKLGAIAERRGRSPAIPRAMVDQTAELYTWVDGAGARRFASYPPAGAAYETLDTVETVLTLTGDQMLRLGVADARISTSAELGDSIGLPGWRQPVAFGTATAAKYAALARNAQQGLRDHAAAVERGVKEARDHSPERSSYTYHTNGAFTDASLVRWRENVERCHLMWRRVSSDISAYGQAIDDAEKAGLPLDLETLRRQHREWKNEASRRISELLAQRHRTGR